MNSIRNIYKTILLVWFMVLYGFIHMNVECFFNEKFKFLSLLYETFITSTVFTAITSLVLISIWVLLIFATLKDRNIPLNKIIIEVLVIEILLLVDSEWATPNSVFEGLSLFGLAALILVLDLEIYGLKWLYYQNYEKSVTFKDSFIVDDHKVEDIDETRELYAISLLSRLRNVKNNDEAYPLVVYGKWGSGKTLFLRCIEKLLEEHGDIVINFNPWNSHSTKQMLISFFDNLSKVLSEYDSSLEKPIIKYADIVTSLDIPKPFELFASSVFGKGDSSVDGLKERIRRSLNRIGKSVYVLMDDLDRLTKSEILDVLCLIRNTANFPYLKYIVACDRNHIVDQLKELKITPNYLEKIFMMELYLPIIYQEYPCVNRCKKAVRAMTDDVDLNQFFELMAKNTSDLLEKSLGNLRQAERFARGLVLNWTFIGRNTKGDHKEVNTAAFLWLELIRIIDGEMYQTLYSDPSKYFVVNKNRKYNQYMYVLKPDDELDKIIGNKCLLDILNTLFCYNEYFALPHDSISLLENYDKYFCLGKAYGHISKTQFLQIMNSESIVSLMDKFSSLEKDSFFNMLLMLDIKKLKTKYKYRYFDFIVLYYQIYGDSYSDNLLSNLLDVWHDVSNDDSIKKYIINRLSTANDNYRQMYSVNLICNKVLKKKLETNCEIIEEDKLRSIIKSNFQKIIEDNQFDAADIVNSNTFLYDFVKSTVVYYSITSSVNDKYIHTRHNYEPIIYQQIIKAFENHKSVKVQNLKDFESINLDSNLSQEDLVERKEIEICKLFGNRQNYEEFKDKCFEQNEFI